MTNLDKAFQDYDFEYGLDEEVAINCLFEESREYNQDNTEFFDDVVRTLNLADTETDFDWTMAA